jgi:3'-phosphoadenosine 5'-phosphosulfate sulfotransferase (PAPS reductase)/FAD synthetase
LADKKVRHVLGVSGGKDSAALALYMRDKYPEIDMEYFFCDTHKELPETYDFLHKLEARLNTKIAFLEPKRGFDHWLDVHNGFLPSATARWCTKQLKLGPLEKFIGDDEAYSYIAIRADEDRVGYRSTKPNIKPIFPFVDDDPGIVKQDVIRILNESGVGMPKYYEWRSRSGCFFCFFQRKYEWVQLAERHPDLFEKAVKYEQEHEDGRKFTWCDEESLLEIVARKDEIIDHHDKVLKMKKENSSNIPLSEVFASTLDDENDDFCFVCNL